MQASVRRFCPLHKTINRGNGTEYLLRCCSGARILHSERPAFTCDCRSHGWVAQLAEQWTENPRVGGSIPPPAIPSSRETLDASVLGFEAYEDFKRNLGPSWAYYLFPVLRGDRWDIVCSLLVLLLACCGKGSGKRRVGFLSLVKVVQMLIVPS